MLIDFVNVLGFLAILLAPSECAPKLDGKDHFHVKYEDERGIENLYILPYIESEATGPGSDDRGIQPVDIAEFAAPITPAPGMAADERPLVLVGPYAEKLEKAERKFNIHRRTFYCNILWSPLDTEKGTHTDRFQIHHHAIHQILFHDAECDELAIVARQHCLHFAKEAFHGSVSPLSETASQNACHYFRSTVFPKEKRRIYLAYKVDSCNKRFYKRLGDVCCWQCVGKRRHTVLNPDCGDIPPDGCEVIPEHKSDEAASEHLLIS